MSSLLIVPISPYDKDGVEGLVAPLQTIFRLPVSVDPRNSLDPSFAFDTFRNQYNSTSIISELDERFAESDKKILGVSSLDFFVPVLTYVFGEAQLDGRIAVVSSHRLDEALYGLPANPELLRDRLVKEAVHELGHVFGLIHCHDYMCVMHASTVVEDIDVKSERFCAHCDAMLKSKVNGSLSAFY
ncbi:MAG TPA: archaemetzincin family Zn-dependent metalloprotease [Bacteroidota bacterium]|nr:archaemetzincin family Zn-dependent metalloprotease [Bacteroidota bacterium]